MNQEEHMAKAKGLLERANQERTIGGDDLLSAEMMWGAFCHCLITVALNNGMPHDSHGSFRHVAQQMDATGGVNTWRPGSAWQNDSTGTSTTGISRPDWCETTCVRRRRPPGNS